jgi:hypothetical protein
LSFTNEVWNKFFPCGGRYDILRMGCGYYCVLCEID